MNITSVTVRRLKTLQGYNNIAIEASATVQPGEVPSAVLNALDFWVQDQIEGTKGVTELRAEHQTLTGEIHTLLRERANLTAEVESLKREVQRIRKTPLEQLASDDATPF